MVNLQSPQNVYQYGINFTLGRRTLSSEGVKVAIKIPKNVVSTKK